MEQTVYVDILWLINFCMDILALGMTARLLQRPMNSWRLCAAAAVGGLWAVIALLVGVSGILALTLDFLIAIGMLTIAFGWGISGWRVKVLGTFFLISFLLGGSMTALSRLFVGEGMDGQTGQESGEFLLLALTGAGITLLCTRVHRRTRNVIRRVSVRLGERSVDLFALEDSGNLLRDPLSGRGVIFVSCRVLRRLCGGRLGEVFLSQQMNDLPSLKGEDARRLRILPGQTVHGRRLMLALLPDAVSVDGEAYAALICPSEIPAGKDYDAIMPAYVLGEDARMMEGEVHQ